MTTPQQVAHKTVTWLHWLPSIGATKSAFYDRIYQKCKGL